MVKSNMKIKKSDIELMAEIISDYKNYVCELDMSDEYIKEWMGKVDNLDDKIWKYLNENKNPK